MDFSRPSYALRVAMNVGVTIIDKEYTKVFELSTITMPVYFSVYNQSLYQTLFTMAAEKNPQEYIYYHHEHTTLSYLGIGIRENDGLTHLAIIGPFLSYPVTPESISTYLRTQSLPLEYRNAVGEYFRLLPYKSAEVMAMGEIACALFWNPYPEVSLSSSPEQGAISYGLATEKEKEIVKDLSKSVTMQYSLEEKFIQAVSKGDEKLAKEINAQFPLSFHYRMPGNSIRIEKNTSYSFSTVMRLAVLQGGVSPITAHLISEHFSSLIERAKNSEEIVKLQFAMIESYCQAVQKNSMKGHSLVVKEALGYIRDYHNEAISLNTVANAISFHPTYVAKAFKKEMGMTVMEYINRQRIEDAVLLLKDGSVSITDVGFLVGFNSYSYFSSVFKRYMGVSCREYGKEN